MNSKGLKNSAVVCPCNVTSFAESYRASGAAMVRSFDGPFETGAFGEAPSATGRL